MLRCGHDCVASSEVRGAKVEETVKKEVMYKWLPVIVEDACTAADSASRPVVPLVSKPRTLWPFLPDPRTVGAKSIASGPAPRMRFIWRGCLQKETRRSAVGDPRNKSEPDCARTRGKFPPNFQR